MHSQQKIICPQHKNADNAALAGVIRLSVLDLRADNYFSAFFLCGDFPVPRPRTVVTVAAIEDTAEKLLELGAQLTEVALKLKQANMNEALLPWTNAHWRSVDKLVEAGLPLLGATVSEINAFKSGRKSTAALEQERSLRDYARRKEREAAAAGQKPEKRPRGRPPGKAT